MADDSRAHVLWPGCGPASYALGQQHFKFVALMKKTPLAILKFDPPIRGTWSQCGFLGAQKVASLPSSSRGHLKRFPVPFHRTNLMKTIGLGQGPQKSLAVILGALPCVPLLPDHWRVCARPSWRHSNKLKGEKAQWSKEQSSPT